jgi:hypothetical protein
LRRVVVEPPSGIIIIIIIINDDDDDDDDDDEQTTFACILFLLRNKYNYNKLPVINRCGFEYNDDRRRAGPVLATTLPPT